MIPVERARAAIGVIGFASTAGAGAAVVAIERGGETVSSSRAFPLAASPCCVLSQLRETLEDGIVYPECW